MNFLWNSSTLLKWNKQLNSISKNLDAPQLFLKRGVQYIITLLSQLDMYRNSHRFLILADQLESIQRVPFFASFQ